MKIRGNNLAEHLLYQCDVNELFELQLREITSLTEEKHDIERVNLLTRTSTSSRRLDRTADVCGVYTRSLARDLCLFNFT